ncbi:hypothetical protein GYMLUDRAFT_927282 [Collybiopsis luxurians FD-317 M1]|uniref:Uncharacterized protein n=1 Tax=Collybiopsis luxurians FD-317 M1 TaxID=944289 RepID=A0A0D0BVC3_9AGAR|nr:hypothetical protein GYMLUDRAFT_927282 [Collybiopsis luxurians FD-317 M1]
MFHLPKLVHIICPYREFHCSAAFERKDGTPFKFRHISQYSQVPLFWPAQWSLPSGCSCHT